MKTKGAFRVFSLEQSAQIVENNQHLFYPLLHYKSEIVIRDTLPRFSMFLFIHFLYQNAINSTLTSQADLI